VQCLPGPGPADLEARETAESKKEEAQTRYDSIALPTEDDLVNFSEAVMAAESALRAFEQPIREERVRTAKTLPRLDPS
jgi:hypothetical protein